MCIIKHVNKPSSYISNDIYENDIIDKLDNVIYLIMNNESHIKPFVNKEEFIEWFKWFCNQYIITDNMPKVIDYFCNKYNIN